VSVRPQVTITIRFLVASTSTSTGITIKNQQKSHSSEVMAALNDAEQEGPTETKVLGPRIYINEAADARTYYEREII